MIGAFILGILLGGFITLVCISAVMMGSREDKRTVSFLTQEQLAEALDKAPDWERVKHGHWDNKIIDARFDVPHTVARCSNCKGKIWVYEENYVVKYPYCPLCGAKMDEVTDGNDTGL